MFVIIDFLQWLFCVYVSLKLACLSFPIFTDGSGDDEVGQRGGSEGRMSALVL